MPFKFVKIKKYVSGLNDVDEIFFRYKRPKSENKSFIIHLKLDKSTLTHRMY